MRSPSLILLLLAMPATATAGGIGRPNVFGATALGIGGAGFAGVPDPSTIHYNPAGILLSPRTEVLGSAVLVMHSRTWLPPGGEEERGGTITPAPALGVSSRFASRDGKRPMPFALGLGFYNSFGGALDFEGEVSPGITSTQILLLEAVPTAAYQLSSQLAVGVGLRIGFGLFHVVNTEREGVRIAPADLSGFGISVGATVGVTYQPLRWLRVGLVYASPMKTEMKGDGEVEVTEGHLRPDNVSLRAPWPQWAALGLALRPAPTIDLYLGARWVDWSAFDDLTIDMSVINNVVDDLDFSDGLSAHAGLEWRVHPRFALRGGLGFDGNTIPDRTVQRQYLDMDKLTLALGGGLRLVGSLYLDLAYELALGLGRDIPTLTTTDSSGQEVQVNAKPGEYSFVFHSLALAVRYSY